MKLAAKLKKEKTMIMKVTRRASRVESGVASGTHALSDICNQHARTILNLFVAAGQKKSVLRKTHPVTVRLAACIRGERFANVDFNLVKNRALNT